MFTLCKGLYNSGRVLESVLYVFLSPCLFNLYAENIMRNAGLDELQVGIKIGGRKINNFRYVDDTILMAESKEELKNLLVRLKEEDGKANLIMNIKLRLGRLNPLSSVPLSSVTQSCPTLCDPMNRSTPGLPVHHHLPEFTQTHIH